MTSAQYSIGVTTNRFELFDLGDEDPLELIKKQEEEREAKKKAKINEKEKEVVKPKTPAAPKVKAEKKPSKEFQPEGPKVKEEPLKNAPRDDRKPNQEFRTQRNNYRNQDDREKENYRSREDQDRGVRGDRDGDRYQQDDGGFRRSSEFGRGGGRGGGRGQGGPGYRGRTFQRGGGGRSYGEKGNREEGGNREGGNREGGNREGGNREGGNRDGGNREGGGRGRREFDRHSGSNRTGVRSTDKRDGSGGHNWGNVKDDWHQTNEEELNTSNDKENWETSNNEHNSSAGPEEWTGPSPPENAQWNPETGNNNAGKAGSQAGDPAAPVQDRNENPDAPTDADASKEELTLDEWKAKKAPKSTPEYNLRKAGEGEDLTQWKKMYALRKKKEEEDDEDEEYEYIEIPQRVGRQRHVLDIDIRYKDSRGSNTGRGGRGRGRGGFRGNQDRPPIAQPREREYVPPSSTSAKEIPKVDDERDFPSLS